MSIEKKDQDIIDKLSGFERNGNKVKLFIKGVEEPTEIEFMDDQSCTATCNEIAYRMALRLPSEKDITAVNN